MKTERTTKKVNKSSRKTPASHKTTKKKEASVKGEARGDDTCFTVMPFGGYFDRYYATIFRPAVEAAGLKPCRADDLYRPSAIVKDIWTYTKNARIILADLTGKNPNVFYELGLAHALAKPAILVTESLEDIPFDLRGLRIIQYNKNEPAWGKILKERIEASIKETLKSPHTAVLPTFLDIKNKTTKLALTPQEKEIIQLKQDIDLLQREMSNTQGIGIGRKTLLDPDEAEQFISELIALGVPKPVIQRNLMDRGVPPEWAQRRIKELLSRQKDDKL